MQQQETILFKVNTGLGYDFNNKCNPLQSQKHIAPQVAMIKSMTAQEANARFLNRNHSYDQQSMADYRKHYPYVFSTVKNPKWAGVL
jgi:hypothetical protein